MSSPYKGQLGKGGGGELVDEGQHLAVIVAMIDLGTHVEPGYQGSPDREVRKCFFAFELVNEEMESGDPFIVGREYTASLHSKSGLVQMLQKVRGREYQDGEDVDVTACVGKPCQVLIQHTKSASGRTYAKIADVTAPPKGTKVGKGKRQPVVFIISEEDDDLVLPTQDWLPYTIGEKLSEKIERSPEWRALNGQTDAKASRRPATNGNGNGNGNGKAAKQEEEDEVPF